MRQYIGARYVPKFEGAWSGSRTYEVLSVVSYNGDSYTSKKPVPVGVAPTNTTYWALTGAYNAQVEQYRQEVENATSNRTIFISDSYGINNGGWIDEVAGTGLIDSDDVIKLANGGIGFHDGGYLTLLQNASISDPESITRIVVCGGANDHTMTVSDITDGIDAFVTYAKANFPNAKLYLGHIGWSTNATLRQKYTTITIPGYKACDQHGMIYLTGVEYSLHYYGYIDADGIHPTTYGCKALAKNIMQALENGTTEVYWTQSLGNTVLTLQGNTWNWYTQTIGGRVNIITNDFDLTFSNDNIAANTDHTIGPVTTSDFLMGYPNVIYNYIPCTILVNDTDFVPAVIGLKQTGTNAAEMTLKVFKSLTGVNKISFPNIVASVDLLYV